MFCLTGGTAFGQARDPWIDLYRSDGYAPNPSPDSFLYRNHGPSVWDTLFAPGVPAASARLLDAESYVCTGGATA